MSSSYTGVFAVLPAAADEAEKAKVANNFLIDAVYQDFKPSVATEWDTIKVNVAASTYSVTNVTNSALSLSDVTATPVSIQLAFHPAIYFKIPDFDQARSSVELRELFLDEAIKKISNYIDAQLGAIAIAANFTVNDAVSGGTAATIADVDMSTAWEEMASNDVPVRDEGNFSLALHPAVYANQLQQASWVQQSYVGDISSNIRRTAIIGRQWGALADYDRFMNVTTSKYTSLLFHRYAIGLVARALPMTKGLGGVESTTVFYKGLPLRITVDYNQALLGPTVTVDALFGCAVTRPDYGCVISS